MPHLAPLMGALLLGGVHGPLVPSADFFAPPAPDPVEAADSSAPSNPDSTAPQAGAAVDAGPDAASVDLASSSPSAAARAPTSAPPAVDPRLDELRAELEALNQRVATMEAQAEAQARAEAAADAEAEAEGMVFERDGSGAGPSAQRPQPVTFDQWTAGNAMATRVTFAFADDNLLAGPADRSPQAGFNLPDDELFFENLTQEKRGYETETQLVVYKRMPSYFRRLDAEAAFVVELQNWINEKTFENETRIGDDGSYLKLNWWTKRDDYTGDRVSLTLFPMDSQRFLLGYTFDITWGGERIFPNNTGQVPGARLKYDFRVGSGKDSYVFVGAKTARLINDDLNEPQTYYGTLGGWGLGLAKWLVWEVNGGYFQRGAFPPQGTNFPGVGGKTSQAFGASTRLSFRKGEPIGSSIDFRLFKYAPDATLMLTQPQAYDDKFAFLVAVEYTGVAQTLLAWDQPNQTVLSPAMAGSLMTRLRYKKLRVMPSLIFRDAGYVTFNVPGLAPYKAFPEGADVKPEYFGALAVDYFFPGPRLTPGAVFAYKSPATYTAGGTTTVLRDEDDWETLPPGEGAFKILASKLTLKWDVARFFVVISELRYTLDNNRTKYVQIAGESGRERVFDDPNITNRLGFFILAQARW